MYPVDSVSQSVRPVHYMKKIIPFFLAVVMLLSLAACSDKPDTSDNIKGDLSDIMSTILDGVETAGSPAQVPVDDETFSYYFFIDPIEGAEYCVSESQINAIAHSVCLLRLPEDADAAQIAADSEENADPGKWSCVEAEKTIVKQKGSLILLVMSFEDTADAIAANFDALQ